MVPVRPHGVTATMRSPPTPAFPPPVSRCRSLSVRTTAPICRHPTPGPHARSPHADIAPVPGHRHPRTPDAPQRYAATRRPADFPAQVRPAGPITRRAQAHGKPYCSAGAGGDGAALSTAGGAGPLRRPAHPRCLRPLQRQAHSRHPHPRETSFAGQGDNRHDQVSAGLPPASPPDRGPRHLSTAPLPHRNRTHLLPPRRSSAVGPSGPAAPLPGATIAGTAMWRPVHSAARRVNSSARPKTIIPPPETRLIAGMWRPAARAAKWPAQE